MNLIFVVKGTKSLSSSKVTKEAEKKCCHPHGHIYIYIYEQLSTSGLRERFKPVTPRQTSTDQTAHPD